MAVPLPAIVREDFARRLAAAASPGPPLEPPVVDRLHRHYEELRRWSPRLSLVGPGTVGELVERHYAESLEGARLVGPGRLLDLGSGAGFPGLVLAALLPATEVTLSERRSRKVAFLRAAARRMGVTVKVLEGDLQTTLPRARSEALDFVTLRAVRLDGGTWRAVLECLKPGARVLTWCGRDPPAVPGALLLESAVPLGGSRRRIVCHRYQP